MTVISGSPDPPSPMLGVVAGLRGVLEDVEVGGLLAVRLQVGGPGLGVVHR